MWQPGPGEKVESIVGSFGYKDYKAWLRWPSGFWLAEMNGCWRMVENLLLYMLIKLKKGLIFLKSDLNLILLFWTLA